MTTARRSAIGRGRGPLAGEGRWALLFLAPTLIGLAVLSAGPIIATLAISLTRWDLLTAPQLTGLDNYGALLSDDRYSSLYSPGEKQAIAQYGSSDSGASLGDILGAALKRATEKKD